VSAAEAETSSVVAEPGESWMRFRGLTKRYGGVAALTDVDLELRAGQVVGLIGPNGAGKSTLVKIIAGAVQRDEGSITLDGQEVDFASPATAQAHNLVLMPQEIALVPDQTVVENVTLGAEAGRWGIRSGRRCREETAAALAAVGLDVDLDALAGSLAAPHQRMLMMARAVHREARLLILDEPTAGLAENEARLVVAGVRRLLDQQLTVVYVSHHLSEVAELADRVVCVREGRVVADVPKERISKKLLVNLLLDVDPDSAEQVRHTRTAHSTAARPSVQLRSVSGRRLREVSLEARAGEVLGLTGLLGSGVAELVSVIVGAQQPAAGSLEVHGRPVSLGSPAQALHRGVGYLPGDRARSAFTTLPIRENVSLPALRRWFGRLGLVRRTKERALVAGPLGVLSVTGGQELPISALSGGNQQRALVARLIAADVDVIVLDEPTVGVDIRARAQLWGAVRALAEDRTVIVASSDPEELAALCDRVVCIRHGRVAAVLEGEAISEHAITDAIA
jgi:ABC-type sugar transport system ATPase subunit